MRKHPVSSPLHVLNDKLWPRWAVNTGCGLECQPRTRPRHHGVTDQPAEHLGSNVFLVALFLSRCQSGPHCMQNA